MAFRPIPLKCWLAFLTLHGYKHTRTTASHYQWTKPNSRSIPVWGDEKDVPPLHLKTGCRTIGVTMQELYDWVSVNC